MKVIETSQPGVFIIEPKVLGDERDFFFDSFNQLRFNFLQDNHSSSVKGVLRGLHY